MKKLQITYVMVLLLCTVFINGCTENKRVRKFGGKEEIILKENEKLLNITWKENNLWLLTEDTLTHVKYFRENSSWGIWEGEIIIK